MSTGIESFDKAAELGAIYPFQGSEGFLVLICALFWLGWHIWQLRNESRECDVEIQEMKDKGQANKALQPDAGHMSS